MTVSHGSHMTAAPQPAGSVDYSVPVLEGAGDTDYARYMKTDVLLSLQRGPDEVIHPDELLFQIVHQSAELWLKHAGFEVQQATAHIRAGELDAACRLLSRASLGIELITGELEMLTHLTPWSFQEIRTVLGHGSGFESPGWRSAREASRALGDAFHALLAERDVDLAELYRGSPDTTLYRLAEALIEWDDRIAVWRARHFKIATRIIGHGSIGTKGTPVDSLGELISRKQFPTLWQVRSELTETGPMGCPQLDPCSPSG
jgi:tryptophan 2,3-dioxygenase